jgi:salicylate hydroxylase
MTIERVAIIGAGIAGLTAALSFARHGIASDVFEEAPTLMEVGAGLQVSPNASRILSTLGLLPALEAVWTEPDRIALTSGTSLKSIAYVPSGRFARERWNTPYGVLHRATLQKVLLSAVEQNPLCRIHLNTPIRGNANATLMAAAGLSYPLVIGADGVWSNLRAGIPGAPTPHFSGNVAWRFTLPKLEAPSWLPPGQVTAFLGPSTHLVAYPLNDVGSINMVAIASGISAGQTWNAKASALQRRSLIEHFHKWDRRIISMLESAGQPTFWPLYSLTSGRWQSGGNTVLIGDAAHAMMPFAAQGAAMAIEDAFVLAGKIAGSLPLVEALSSFETERKTRIAKVRARGLFNRFAYHARGPVRLGRDLVLSMRPPQSLAADFDWLYGYKPF